MPNPLSTFLTANVTLATHDIFWITSTGQLSGRILGGSDADPATFIEVAVLGEVVSLVAQAIVLQNTSVAGGHTLTIGSTGQVLCSSNFAAVVMDGQTNAFHNTGLISGGGGVVLNLWQFGLFQNDGEIIGTRFYGLQMINSFNQTIQNSGLISGVGGIILNNSGVGVVNQGEIRSTSATQAAVDADTGASAVTLRNSGSVIGVTMAVQGGTGVDLVVNSGLIDGNVDLGAGADVFRGKQGTLLGTLSGGAQNDLLAGGNGDQFIYGGTENDVLNGNAGDDTLFGGNGNDTFVFTRNGDDDIVNGFQNGTDKIDVSAFHFATFTALSARATDAPGGMLIDLGSLNGGTIFMAGFTKALFGASDVLL